MSEERDNLAAVELVADLLGDRTPVFDDAIDSVAQAIVSALTTTEDRLKADIERLTDQLAEAQKRIDHLEEQLSLCEDERRYGE